MATPQRAPGAPAGGSLPLPRPPGFIRRASAAHPRLVDALVAFLPQVPIALIGIVLAVVPSSESPLTGLGVVGVSAAVGTVLLWRRRFPLLIAILCTLPSFIPNQAAIGAWVALYIALFSLGAYARARTAWIGFGVVAVLTGIAGTIMQLVEPASIGPIVSVNLIGIATYLVALLIGTSVRARRAYVEALIARADDLERERDQQAQLAAAAERARIAREMHDVVSHSLTVMITLAEGSAAQVGRTPERAGETMRKVAESGRDSLAEMRRLLGVLRDPGESGSREPQPEAADLATLVASFRDADVPVRLTTSGTTIAHQGLAIAVHRIVQEALTNVLRHAADATRVDVAVTHRDGEVRVSIVDDGSGQPASTTGSGRGLVGIRERAAMFGGEVEAGPLGTRGWSVVVTLPEPESPGAA